MPPWVKDYIGIPFKEKGRDRNGCDCWGLVYLILRAVFNIDVPSYAEGYETVQDQAEIMALRDRELPSWREVVRADAMAGDVIALRIQGEPTHYGLVLEPGLMLHTHKGIDSCAERYDGLLWKHRIVGIYRHVSRIEVPA